MPVDRLSLPETPSAWILGVSRGPRPGVRGGRHRVPSLIDGQVRRVTVNTTRLEAPGHRRACVFHRNPGRRSQSRTGRLRRSSLVPVMESAHFGELNHLTHRGRQDRAGNRRVLPKPQMGPRGVVVDSHLADELADLDWDGGSAWRSLAAFPRPIPAESSAVPIDHGLGSDEVEVSPPMGPGPGEQDPEGPIPLAQPRTLPPAL